METNLTRRRFLRLGGAVVVTSSLAAAPRRTETKLSRGLALGCFPGTNNQWGNTDAVDAYTSLVGRKPAIVNCFQAWHTSDGYRPFHTSGFNYLYSRYPLAMLSWEPKSRSSSTFVTLDSIVMGNHDQFVRNFATAIKNFGKRILLRWGHEMNGRWYPWGQQPWNYREAWKRCHNIFQSVGATNAEWVFCPNVRGPVLPELPAMSQFYPGDAYVDWLSLDGYNWVTARHIPWRSFEQVFAPSLNEIETLNYTAQVVIAETGCDSAGGDKAAWLQAMRTYLKNNRPRVAGLMYFHCNMDGACWRLDYPEAATPAYKEMVNDAQFQWSLRCP